MFDFNHPNPNGWSPASAPHQRLRGSNGFWIAVLGGKTRLRCIQCHDPHSPKFKPMTPLPPPAYPPRGAHPPPKSPSEPGARLVPARREVGAAGLGSPRECLDCSSIGPLLFLYSSRVLRTQPGHHLELVMRSAPQNELTSQTLEQFYQPVAVCRMADYAGAEVREQGSSPGKVPSPFR